MVHLDDKYTSPELVDLLNESQTDCAGIVKQSQKGVPDIIQESKLKKVRPSEKSRCC
jgi:hypothetical protein